MAQELDDGEFWLPSEFLTDDDLLTDFKAEHFQTKRNDDFSLGFGNSFGFNSDLSSPVESVMGSTETESDEDDFITGLTQKLAHSTLQDSNFFSDYRAKGWKLSGSPQSTLCGCKPGSSRGSPNCVSRVSSPPDSKDVVGWDLLYAAAGEVARMRMIDEATPFHSTKVFAPPPKPCPVTVPVKKPSPASGFYPNQTQTEAHLAYMQLQATQFQRMKQQQQQQQMMMMKSGVWGEGKMDYQFQNGRTGGAGRAQGLSMAAWPTLQQSQQQPQLQPQPGSGMRAVFLGETGAKKERTGTGVFLPRRFGNNPAETRKKPGCSTVLLPDRVVHALNLNLETIDAQSQLRGNGNFTPEYDAALKHRNSLMMAQHRRNLMSQPVMNQELRLPQEWTY